MKREEQRKRHLYTVDSSHERGEEWKKEGRQSRRIDGKKEREKERKPFERRENAEGGRESGSGREKEKAEEERRES
jgi:hypothetical protein